MILRTFNRVLVILHSSFGRPEKSYYYSVYTVSLHSYESKEYLQSKCLIILFYRLKYILLINYLVISMAAERQIIPIFYNLLLLQLPLSREN